MNTTQEVLAKFDAHRELWAATLHETPDGWTEHTCTAYRMALDWVAETLEPLREVTDEEPRCQHVSPTPWGYAQCALPLDHEDHAYSPSEAIEDAEK